MLVAITGRRVRRDLPRQPPAGTLPGVVQLTLAHALPLRAHDQGVVMDDLMRSGHTDAGPAGTTRNSESSRRRARHLRLEAARFARQAPTPAAVQHVAEVLGRAGVRTVDDVLAELARAGTLEHPLPLTVMQRLLTFYGLPAPEVDVRWPSRPTDARQAAGPPSSSRGRGRPRADGDAVVLVPAVDRPAVQGLLNGLQRQLQADIAVWVPPPSWGSAAAVAGLVAAHPLLHVLRSSRHGVWVCRRWVPGAARPGTAANTARRVLSAEALSAPALLGRLQAAWQQQPASTRGPGTAPPPLPVLRAWLHHVAERDPGMHTPATAPPNPGPPGWASPAGRGWWWDHPLADADVALLQAAAIDPARGVPADTLLQALINLGYSRGAATQYLLRSPHLHRRKKDRYVRRSTATRKRRNGHRTPLGGHTPLLALTAAALLTLTGCAEERPLFSDQDAAPRTTTVAAEPPPRSRSVTPTPSPTEPTTPSSSATAQEPSTQAAPIAVQDGFLSLRFDCIYVPDSFQDEWTQAGADQEGFGEPRPGQRYSFGHIGGRALVLLPPAFNTGLLDRDRLRFKAEAPGPGQVVLWVTKPNPDPELAPDEVASTLQVELTVLMSTTNPRADGSCTVSGSEPLPPINADVPDDTQDAK